MTMAMIGGLLGLTIAVGGWLIVGYVLSRRHPALADRVEPYLRDLPQAPRMASEPLPRTGPAAAGWAVFGPSLRGLARTVEQVLRGGAAVRRQGRNSGRERSAECA